MKKVKCFVLSLLMCFSFGCGPSYQKTKTNLIFLLENVEGVQNYQCTRSAVNTSYQCKINISNEIKYVICSDEGCVFKQCKNDNFCFDSKANDTE